MTDGAAWTASGAPGHPSARYVPGLLVFTAATGVVDGVSFVGLDHVFTGNMTGNALFLAFALVGAPDLPVPNLAVALVAFFAGALLAGLIERRARTHPRLGAGSVVALAAVIAVQAICAGVLFVLGTGPDAVAIGVAGALALALGAQAATLRAIGARDLSTIVVTLPLVNAATDLTGPRERGLLTRRFVSVGAILVGGALGALAALQGVAWTGLVVAALVSATGLWMLVGARGRETA